MKKIAISVGDLNGVGLEIILKSHTLISQYCKPIYFANIDVFKQASHLLKIKPFFLDSMACEDISLPFVINPSEITAISGAYSFASFKAALDSKLDIATLPINKYAWHKAGISFLGHTEYLREYFKKDAIMMLGCKRMFVALFSDHVSLKEVPKLINLESLKSFLSNYYHSYFKLLDHKSRFDFDIDFNDSLKYKQEDKVLVLGLNPHAGDNGILGSEDAIIKQAIKMINKDIGKEVFIGPISPDCAFIPKNRERFSHFIAMYHDVGLSALKALYFDVSINVSLNLPIKRSSVDHGVGYDIAYFKARHDRESNKKDASQKLANKELVSRKSFIQAIKFLSN